MTMKNCQPQKFISKFNNCL